MTRIIKITIFPTIIFLLMARTDEIKYIKHLINVAVMITNLSNQNEKIRAN